MSLFFVSAQPPVQFSVSPDGYLIRTNALSTHGLNTDLNVTTHVYNETNGVPVTTGISCYYNLYSPQGTQIYTAETSTLSDLFDFEFHVDKGNFSQNGDYPYVIQCNSTSAGGFLANTIKVTPNGEEPTIAKSVFYIGLLGVLIFFLVLMFWAHMQDQSHLARFWWFAFMWIPIWSILFIGWNMARDFLTSQGGIQSVLYIFWLVIGLAYPFFLLGLVLYTFYYIYKQKEVQRLITRGFSVEDAQGRVNGRGRGMNQW